MTDYDMVKRAVEEAMKEQMKDFYIDRERHYKHHEFLQDWMNWAQDTKSTCGKVLTTIIVTGVISLLMVGFVMKVGGYAK